MEKPHWRATALAIATAVLLGVSSSGAHALALGRITVQSAIGEPLHAEIDIPEINAEELASLRTSVASPDAFRAAGLEYSPALSGIKITLERRPDGRHFLRLSSQRPVTEPFVDLILETNWASGRIVRDYTLLFDPPNLRQTAPLAAQVTPAAPAQRSRTAPAAATAPSAAPAARAPAAPVARAAPAREPAANPPSGDGKQVTVQAGDTAGRIASANKSASVSLDQMLVALLRANPDAFIGGNVNRLKSGAVLDVPTAEQAGLVPSDEATQSVIAQSRDFNEFRRRLAEGLPTTGIGAAERQASGKVQAQVEEKKAAAPTPDKLTLSKGAVQAKAAEEKIARERAAQDAATRVAELNKNISDLNKLGVATAPAGSGSTGAAKPGVTLPVGPAAVPAPAAVAASAQAATAIAAASAAKAVAPAATAAASSPAPATAVPAAVAATSPASDAVAASPAAAASAPLGEAATAAMSSASAAAAAPLATLSASAAKASPAAAPAAPVETTLVEDLLENPIVPATIGGILALLLGFGFYRAQQRKKSTQVDSSFLESRLQPDSFFGASGGQRIDTNEGGATGSSLVYSPSQLDAAGDVDPVAEADVYLAYGRDLQAEEILKEAMRTTPQRVAIHSKLLEIYSKRRDAKAFELVATEAYGLTRGEGPDWEHISGLGQELDPSNSLYRPGGQPISGSSVTAKGPVAAASAAVGSFGATTPTQAVPAAAPMVPDLDLDLDFSLGDEEPAAPAPAPAPATAHAATQPIVNLNKPAAPQPAPSLDMDFGSATVALEAPGLTVDPSSLSFTAEPPKAAAAPPAAAAPVADAGMIEFDLGALSLDLPASPAAPVPAAAAPAARERDTDEAPLSTQGASLISADYEDSSGDPLATKLALAEEFNAIGDPDGARSLAQEVLAEASGDLKSRAQRFLAEIS